MMRKGKKYSVGRSQGKVAVKLCALGEILIREHLLNACQQSGRNIFEGFQPWLDKADISFINLETPLISTDLPPNPAKPSGYPLLKCPPFVAGMLKDAGISLVSLANNHIMDYGDEGYVETVNNLNETGIQHIGIGHNLADARIPVIFEVNGIRVGFLSYCNAYVAQTKQPGCAPVSEQVIIDDLRALEKKSDVNIVSIHQGVVFSDLPTREQVALYRKIISEGADIILGHHSHVLQGMEVLDGGIIIYSMGNLINDKSEEEDRMSLRDSYISQKGGAGFLPDKRCLRESMMFIFEITEDVDVSVSLFPTYQANNKAPIVSEEPMRSEQLRQYEYLSKRIYDGNDPMWIFLDGLAVSEMADEISRKNVSDILKNIHKLRMKHLKSLPLLIEKKLTKLIRQG